MKRNVTLAEISDGRLYGENDMVKADCHGCQGCASCCSGMGDSIILDPYDVYRMTVGLGQSFQELLAMGKLTLGVVDGVILPHLTMVGEKEECAFLDGDGRCSIHAHRPGICRLFPLGRFYDNGDFKYFLQVGECPAERGKIKVSKWISTPALKRNHEFLVGWHYLLNDLEETVLEEMKENSGREEEAQKGKQLNMALLQLFFLTAYDGESDFYEQFEKRLEQFRALQVQIN